MTSFLRFNGVLTSLLLIYSFTQAAATSRLAAPEDGKALFQTHCAACHDFGKERIGPWLSGATQAWPGNSLEAFIRNPSAIIASGNKRAVALKNRYKTVMPGFDFLSTNEMRDLVSYIKTESAATGIAPFDVSAVSGATKPRLAKAVAPSKLTVGLEDFVTIPASSDQMPRTRISNMRPHPSGDGRLYVSDQRGLIHVIQGRQVSLFLDLRSMVENYIDAPGLGTGLGSFAFHPDFLTNGLIYVTHTEKFTGKPADYAFPDSIKTQMQWVLSEWKMSDIQAPVFEGTRREMLRVNVPSPVHGMQDIGFIPGIDKTDPNYGLLYIGMGDGGSTIGGHPELCHNLHSLLGTIMRINPLGRNSANGQYGIPPENPFAESADQAVRREIYAYGFRNPHRLSWDLRNGQTMYEAEVSESNFEEINVIVKGGDYGWNVREGTYGISYVDLKNVFPVESKPGEHFIAPFAVYDHVDGSAISGGYVYDGKFPPLKNKYVFGDIVNGRLFFVNAGAGQSDRAVYELKVSAAGHLTNLKKLSGSKRVDLRIEYDPFRKDMYIMTKADGKIRKITSVVVAK